MDSPIISARNPMWACADHKNIVLLVTLVDSPDEEVEFVACANSRYEYCNELHAAALAGDFGEISEPREIDNGADAESARRKRNYLLSQTDWTQMVDVPKTTKDLWAPYRQKLRDLPTQPDFPKTIVWPTPPK